MQWLMKCCARGVLGLGAVALLLAGGQAHARPATGALILAPAGETTWQEKGCKEQGQWPAGGWRLAPAVASREGQPLRLAQSTAQQEEAEKLKQQRLKEQQEKEKVQEQPRKAIKAKKMRGPVPEMERSAPSAIPAKPGGSRFGAGVIRHGDPGEAE